MRTGRFSRLASAFTFAGALALVGCGGKGGGATTSEIKGSAAGPGTTGGGLAEKTASITYALFPADATFVMGVTGEQVRKSKLAMGYLSQFAGGVDQLKQLKACGLDLVNQLDTMVVAINQASTDGVMVVRGFTAGDLSQCATRAPDLTLTQEGNLQVVVRKEHKAYVAWLDSNTALVGRTKAKIEAGRDSQGGLDKNGAMTALLDKIDTGAALYVSMVLPADKTQTPLGTINGMFGSVFLDGGLKVKAGLAMPDDAASAGASKMINAQLGSLSSSPFGPFLSGLKVQENGPDLGIDLSLTDDQLVKLIDMVRTNPLIQMMLQRAVGGGSGGTTPTPPPGNP